MQIFRYAGTKHIARRAHRVAGAGRYHVLPFVVE